MLTRIHWLPCLTMLALVLMAAPLQAQQSQEIRVAALVSTIGSRIATQEDRQQAEKELKVLAGAAVLGPVLAEIEALREQPDAGGFGGYGVVPEAELPATAQATLALWRVWGHFIQDAEGNQGATLARLLNSTHTNETRYYLLDALKHHWVAEAEVPVAALLSEHLLSAEILLKHLPKKYGPVLVTMLTDKKRVLAGRVALVKMFNRQSYQKLGEKHRNRLIASGFAILQEERLANPNYVHGGCLLAGHLGWLLEREFAANVHDPKYRGRDGNLKEDFFADHVRNALGWWKEQRHQYE